MLSAGEVDYLAPVHSPAIVPLSLLGRSPRAATNALLTIVYVAQHYDSDRMI
jgi:hypothetical protein